VENVIASVSWNGSPVVIHVGEPPAAFSGPDYLKSVEDAQIAVGSQSAWGGIADFTVFMHEGQVGEVDDVLEAGDEDFFTDARTQQDYFTLVRELKNPGSTQVSKSLALYTARPSQDRQLYEGAQSIPSNLFLTTSYDRAEGIAIELAGSGTRDIWKVRIEQRYLIETLNTGNVRDYQVVGEETVPVKGIRLITPNVGR
jgi:hypothetical protein